MNYLNYVNIKQGTASVKRFSNGNTLPLVQLPFGFSCFSVQTNSNRGTWFYHPDDKFFEGIRITHQPSPWIGDHGAMVFLPQTEISYDTFEQSWSGYRELEAKPNYLKCYSIRTRCTIELTPSEYGAVVRLDFDNNRKKFLSVLPVGGDFEYMYDDENAILYCSTNQVDLKGYDSDGFRHYCAFKFNKDDVKNCNKTHIEFNKNKIEFRISESYISYQQSMLNLDDKSFDETKQYGEKVWNEHLSRIKIDGEEDRLRTFYSCMYRVFLYPHKAYEIDKDNRPIHYAPCDGSIKPGIRYTDNGFWDTYRTVYPLLAIIAKEEYKEILEGFIQDYKDGGWLPCWTALDAKKCMPSTMIDAVIADAAIKGIISGDLLKTALEGMIKHANHDSSNPAYGREGCEQYLKYGYVPCDDHNESVNLTLDAAYGDYCISVVASLLGNKKLQEEYQKRSKSYKALFDKATGFMRAKYKSGEFRENFDPISWGLDYTEASAWQTTFAVQHDFDGLAELYGSKEELLKKLDEFFDTPQDYRVGGYHAEIHEMTEFADGVWGQCAISNQPSFHIPFIYAYFGKTDKTRYWVERIANEAFSWKNDGFPGDEDNGTMAAWYIFAAIGEYPLCPGKENIKF